MSRIGIIYFSGTGNTEYICRYIKKHIESTKNTADLINIEKDSVTKKYDYIIIGGPVYVERYPEILFKFIEENLKNYDGNCMLIITAGADDNIAALRHAAHRLAFLNITYCESIIMPNNFCNIMFTKPTEERINELLSSSYKKCDESVDDFLGGKKKVYRERNLYSKIIDLIYKMFYPHFSRKITNKITIDKDKCIRCHLCEKRCPMGSIKIDRENLYDDKCILCQRCMNGCPKDAFIYKGKKYIQYMPKYREMGK